MAADLLSDCSADASEMGPISAINVTPFVDVVLVLLVIFMVTAPMLYRGMDITLPTSSSNTIKPEERIVLTIERDQKIYVDKDMVPKEKIESERRIFVEQVKASGKPENMIDKIVEGKIEAYYRDVCLMHQMWVRDPKKSVGDLVKEVAAKTGENIKVRRFVRYQLGEL